MAISHTEKVLGNQMKRLNYPNLIPIFLGIMLGCIVANIPFFIPGISESLRLGLTGGPLIVAILIGYFGPKHNLVTYNTISANLMIREIGICIFLACVGLGTGEQFIQTVATESGMIWILYGIACSLYTSPRPRDRQKTRIPAFALKKKTKHKTNKGTTTRT